MDAAFYLEELDRMAAEVERRLPSERYPLKVAREIGNYLHDELGFCGSTADNDERNSFLNEVLDRRIGIPVTLSLVYLEIAKRIDFPMVGADMPKHFIVRPEFEDVDVYIDPFNHGEILFPEDCQALLARLLDRPIDDIRQYLLPASPKDILCRMLTNLKGVYLQREDPESLLGCIERLLLLFPDRVDELRDRGFVYYQLQQYRKARNDLEVYLQHIPDSWATIFVQRILEEIQGYLSY